MENNQELIQIKNSSAYDHQDEVDKARDYGILVHHILSQINTKNDVSNSIEKALLNGSINKTESQKITEDINAIITLPSISLYYNDGVIVKNELEILTSMGEVLRPDRVVIQNNDAIVIDYKTGKRNSKKYYQQMQEYEYALKELGYNSVKKILLYIKEREVEIIA